MRLAITARRLLGSAVAFAVVGCAAVAVAAPGSGTGIAAGRTARSTAAGTPSPAPDVITWSVRPADAAGPDGRAWVEQTLSPGESVTEHLAIHSYATEPVTFTMRAADGYLTDTGRFTIVDSDQASTDAGAWIKVQETVDVQPGATAIVPFTLTVPQGARPGDHAAGIAAALTSAGNGGVGVESRVGFRVLVTVPGEAAAALEISQLRIQYSPSWNPLKPGTLVTTYRVTNRGHVRLQANLRVIVRAPGSVDPKVVVMPELLPGGSRTIRSTVSGVWPWGRADVSVEATPLARAGVDIGAEQADARASAWLVPWPQLLWLAMVLLVIVSIRGGRRRQHRRWAGRLDQARAEGRAQALAEVTPPPEPVA